MVCSARVILRILFFFSLKGTPNKVLRIQRPDRTGTRHDTWAGLMTMTAPAGQRPITTDGPLAQLLPFQISGDSKPQTT